MSNTNSVNDDVENAFSFLNVGGDDIASRVSGLTVTDRTTAPTLAASVASRSSLQSTRSSHGNLLSTRQGIPSTNLRPGFTTATSPVRRGADVLRRSTGLSGGGVFVGTEGVSYIPRVGDLPGKTCACIVPMGDRDRCFGLVGDSRLCISECAPGTNGCGNSSKHENNKAKAFVDGIGQMYTVPAKVSKGSLTSFLEPIVPVYDVDTYCRQRTRDEFTKEHTSQEWAALISYAIDEINTVKDEMAEGHEEAEDSTSEEDEPAALGYFNPGTVPYSEYTPPEAVNVPPPVFKIELGSDSEVEKAITEHHEAIATNSDLMKDIAESVPAAVISTIKHLDPTLQGLVTGYNRTVSVMQRVIAGLGNWEQLGAYGHSDLSQAIVAALEVEVDLAVLEETRATIEELQTLVGDMDDRLKSSSTQVIGAIAGQIKKIHVRMLNIESLIPKQQQGLSSVSHLDASTPIIGAGGTDMGTLGTLLERVTTLESNYETLRADISAQGGVVVGPHLIASEEALKKIIAQELKDPKKAIAAFTDGVSIFTHSKDAKVGAFAGGDENPPRGWIASAHTPQVCH